MDPGPKKADLRRVLLERRDATSHDMARLAGRRIFGRLAKLSEFARARSIACYYPIGSEVSTIEIISDVLGRGVKVCLPRVSGDGLEFRCITDMGRLESGPFGTREPRDDAPECGEPDVIIVPSVGLSRDGARLGYGRGYYDRFLSGCGAVSIALAYSKQLVGSVPTAPGDIKVNWIVTEDESFRTRQ